MKDFDYVVAADVHSAVVAASRPGARYLGGGTNLVDLMRAGVERPDLLVDITRLPIDTVEELPDGGLRIGALVRNSHLAAHPTVRQRYPVLAQAVLAGASAQLRNMATVGGNLLQRTRCAYFTDTASPCNKRVPGSGCGAMEGFHRMHAVLGVSDACIAANPSDMCVALVALDAVVEVAGLDGTRRVPLTDLHVPPGVTPSVETTLAPGELIVAVEVPPAPVAASSRYRKVRDRASYAFALVSVAAALEVADGVVSDVRLALGGVASVPWRARRAEAALLGMPATRESFLRAGAAEMAAAVPRAHNAFKVELAPRAIAATLERLAREGSGASAAKAAGRTSVSGSSGEGAGGRGPGGSAPAW